MLFLEHFIKKEISKKYKQSRRIKGTEIRGKHQESHLMNAFKWIAEHGAGFIGIIQTLLRTIKYRNFWRVIIVYVQKEQDKLKKRTNYWRLERVIYKVTFKI